MKNQESSMIEQTFYYPLLIKKVLLYKINEWTELAHASE